MSYSDNIVFLDGEFAKILPGHATQLLSIGLIAPTIFTGSGKRIRPGSELYLEVEPEEKFQGWLERNPIPYLDGEYMPRDAAATIIKDFLGGTKPFLVTDANPDEWMALCNLFGSTDLPFDETPVNFANLLRAAGIDPDIDRYALASRYNIDMEYLRKGYALDDAYILMTLYTSIKDVIDKSRRTAS